ncbi:MAG: BatD family protein [Spirochaetota bacterium]
MKNPGKTISFISLVILLCAPVMAAQIETVIERSRIFPGESVTLTIKVSGSSDVEAGFFSQIPGMSIVYRGSSSSFEYINGKSWRGISLQYAVRPIREGEFTVPAIPVTVDGVLMNSQPVKVTATKKAPRRSRSPFPGISGFPGFPGADEEEPQGEAAAIKGIVKISKSSVYAGEPVLVRYIATGTQGAQLRGFESLPAAQGFIRRDLDEKSDAYTTPQGEKIASFVLIPQKEGTFPVGGGRAVFAGGFAGDIPADFPQSRISVRSLPSSGRPSDFSGAVGSFSLSLDNAKCSAEVYGECRITITVSGSGNFMALPRPFCADLPSDIKMIAEEGDISLKTDGDALHGEKKYVIMLIPEKEGDYALSGFAFSFFDPSSGTYKTAGSGPVTLTVKGIAEKKEESPESGEKKGSGIIILAAVIAPVILLFAGIIIYERRKYGYAQTPEKDIPPQKEKDPDLKDAELSRMKYALTMASEHNDTAAFMSAAEKVLALSEKQYPQNGGQIAALKDALFSHRYGGKALTKEECAALKDRILAVSGY